MPKLAGSFYTLGSSSLGDGVTKQEELRRVNWFAIFLDGDRVLVNATDAKGLPTTVSRSVPLKDFFAKFIPDKTHYENVVLPLLESTRDKLVSSEGKPSRLSPDEMVVYKALQLGKHHVPGATDEELANMPMTLLGELPDYEASFTAHKHELNMASIASRKSGRYQEALELYSALLRATPDDHHIVFNAARVYFEKQDYVTCRKCLQLALENDPDFDAARKFMIYLDKHFLKGTSEYRNFLRYQFFTTQPCELTIDGKKFAGEVIDLSAAGLRMRCPSAAAALMSIGKEIVVQGDTDLLKSLLRGIPCQVVWLRDDVCGILMLEPLDAKSQDFKRIVGYSHIV